MGKTTKRVKTPLTRETVKDLHIGDEVLISGTIYTARDLAHARLVEMIKGGGKLPFNAEGSVVYYVGPSPAPDGRVIGAAGPTTSYRMDPFVPDMFKAGMLGMIGKGPRSAEVRQRIIDNCGVYFAATGGAAALLSRSIVKSEIIAFRDLGAEALRRLTVKDMPVIVVNDCYGGDLYKEGVLQYRA